jgi:hypothetical protein
METMKGSIPAVQIAAASSQNRAAAVRVAIGEGADFGSRGPSGNLAFLHDDCFALGHERWVAVDEEDSCTREPTRPQKSTRGTMAAYAASCAA